jgi:hypothetical protein
VSTFADETLAAVPAAANSVARMREMLTDPGLGGWPEDRVSVFLNPGVVGAFTAGLHDLARQAEDALVFYFVGHGVLSEMSELCLVLSDTRHGYAEAMGLPYSGVRKVLQSSTARVKTVILDCCYSGQAIQALSGGGTADSTSVAGVTTLTAADYAAHVVRAEQQTTACTSFTQHLLDVVHAGRPDGAATLTVQELFPLLRARLLEKNLPAPNIRTTDTAALFPLARNAALAAAADEAAAATILPRPGTSLALVIWRRTGKVFYDFDGRVLGGQADLEENGQSEADRKWWPIARWRFPGLKALVSVVDGEVSHIREVFGVDEEETGEESKLALNVSPPLTGPDMAERIPGLPVTIGAAMPAVQGKLREYLTW